MKFLYISIATVAALMVSALVAPAASAHVLVVDTSGSKGAILHINPNDNPIAGEKAAIIFDTDKDVLGKNSQVTLSVKSADGTIDRVEAKTDGPLAVAEYNFPSQGVYDLSFQVKGSGDDLTFNYTQRVSRGVVSSAGDGQANHGWAKILLFEAGIGMVVLAILALNYRRDIKRDSTF